MGFMIYGLKIHKMALFLQLSMRKKHLLNNFRYFTLDLDNMCVYSFHVTKKNPSQAIPGWYIREAKCVYALTLSW